MTFDEIVNMTKSGFSPPMVILMEDDYEQFIKDMPPSFSAYGIQRYMVNGVEIRGWGIIEEYERASEEVRTLKGLIKGIQLVLSDYIK